jgi:hypothetical protein
MKPAIPPRRYSLGRVALSCTVVALPVVVYVATMWVHGKTRATTTVAGFQLVTVPVVETPPTVAAVDAGVWDGTEVIGVSVADRHRAYVVEALAPLSRHVINDLLNGVPCTVSYCDRSDRVRVFTEPGAKEPLEVAVGGFDSRSTQGGMLLRIGTDHYRQDTGLPWESTEHAAFPYPALKFYRTTWGEWRKVHPDSDIYVGH